MTIDASLLGSLYAVDGEGVVRMEIASRLRSMRSGERAGQVKAANSISGRELRNGEAPWNELFPA